MKHIISFDDFLNENRAQELGLQNENQADKKVNFMIGRFQPPTLGHLKVLESLSKENGFPVVVIAVRAKKVDLTKTPFDPATIKLMWDDIIKNNKYIIDYKEITNGSIVDIYNVLRPKYEPVLWGTGTDRLKVWKAQVDKYKFDMNSLPEFDTFEIKRNDDDISASKVRESLREGDTETFNKMMPPYLHGYFQTLKSQLM